MTFPYVAGYESSSRKPLLLRENHRFGPIRNAFQLFRSKERRVSGATGRLDRGDRGQAGRVVDQRAQTLGPADRVDEAAALQPVGE